MKKFLLILIAVTLLVQQPGRCQTNADYYSAYPGITNIYYGITSNDASRDSYLTLWQKINHNFIWIARQINTATSTVATISYLTNLPATNLAQLSANNVFTGSNRYAGVMTATNPANVFAGNGGSLSNLNGAKLQSGTVNSNALDSATLAWLSSLGSGGRMNFDSGQITSDGNGEIKMGSVVSSPRGTLDVNAPAPDDPYGQTSASTAWIGSGAGSAEIYFNYGAGGGGDFGFVNGAGGTWELSFGGNQGGPNDDGRNFYFYDRVYGGNFAQFDPYQITFTPQTGVGIGTSPSYMLDVGGDINFSGILRLNTLAVLQPDTSGNGGTTLMLQAQDNGTQMFLHITSAGVITATTSP